MPPANPFIRQANGSDGGSTGVGLDNLGFQARDWTVPKILARIDGHVSGNQYGFIEVYVKTDGTTTDQPGGITSDGMVLPAFEVNGNSSVADGTVVEMWPEYGPYPSWSFSVGTPGADGSSGVLVKAFSATAAGGSGVDAECYDAKIATVAAGTALASFALGDSVWLTISGEAGAEAPIVGLFYVCVLSSDTHTISGDTRKRAIAQPILATECITIYSSRCVDGSLETTPVTMRVLSKACP